MVTFNAHFDGKVLVPDEPVTLEPNQRFRVNLEAINTKPAPNTHNAGDEQDAVWEKGTLPESKTDWSSLIGIGLPLPENHTPRFNSHEDLWDKTK